MVSKREVIIVVFISIGISLLTLVPYILANRIAQPTAIFSGFLMNPIDGFSYLAKMRQGSEGDWLYHLAYARDPGEGTLMFVYYLFLGYLAKWTHLELIQVYHLARIVFATVMFTVAYLFLARVIHAPTSRRAAFAFIVLGSGLGWLGIPFGFLSTDLWVPESIPFLSAYANAHFPLATALILGLVLFQLGKARSPWLQMGLTFVLAFALAAIQPFALITLGVVIFVWLLWEICLVRYKTGMLPPKDDQWRRISTFLAMLAGAAPWLAYDYWILQSHPQLANWAAQNLTPSPPLMEFLLGFGLIFLFALVGIFHARRAGDAEGRLLITWLVLGFALLYAPFGLQRRLSMALFFPMVSLAVYGIERLASRQSQFRFLFMAVLILSIPSNLIVVGSGMAGVAKNDPAVVLQRDELEAYQWLSQHATRGDLVLAGARAGNRIPAYADLRVLYGHPFETPYAEQQEELAERLYSSMSSAEAGLNEMLALGVHYIFYGPEEKSLGAPNWLVEAKEIFRSGEYTIYEIAKQ
jgi:hypothetical protein